MNILIEASEKLAPNAKIFRKHWQTIKYEGVTGIIQFDEKGNRKGTPGFVVIKNGIPVHCEMNGVFCKIM